MIHSKDSSEEVWVLDPRSIRVLHQIRLRGDNSGRWSCYCRYDTWMNEYLNTESTGDSGFQSIILHIHILINQRYVTTTSWAICPANRCNRCSFKLGETPLCTTGSGTNTGMRCCEKREERPRCLWNPASNYSSISWNPGILKNLCMVANLYRFCCVSFGYFWVFCVVCSPVWPRWMERDLFCTNSLWLVVTVFAKAKVFPDAGPQTISSVSSSSPAMLCFVVMSKNCAAIACIQVMSQTRRVNWSIE